MHRAYRTGAWILGRLAGGAWLYRLIVALLLVDPVHYRRRYGTRGAVSAWLDFWRRGFAGNRSPCIGFDAEWYLARNPDVAGAGVPALLHYLRNGLYEGRLGAADRESVLIDCCGPAPRETMLAAELQALSQPTGPLPRPYAAWLAREPGPAMRPATEPLARSDRLTVIIVEGDDPAALARTRSSLRHQQRTGCTIFIWGPSGEPDLAAIAAAVETGHCALLQAGDLAAADFVASLDDDLRRQGDAELLTAGLDRMVAGRRQEWPGLTMPGLRRHAPLRSPDGVAVLPVEALREALAQAGQPLDSRAGLALWHALIRQRAGLDPLNRRNRHIRRILVHSGREAMPDLLPAPAAVPVADGPEAGPPLSARQWHGPLPAGAWALSTGENAPEDWLIVGEQPLEQVGSELLAALSRYRLAPGPGLLLARPAAGAPADQAGDSLSRLLGGSLATWPPADPGARRSFAVMAIRHAALARAGGFETALPLRAALWLVATKAEALGFASAVIDVAGLPPAGPAAAAGEALARELHRLAIDEDPWQPGWDMRPDPAAQFGIALTACGQRIRSAGQGSSRRFDRGQIADRFGVPWGEVRPALFFEGSDPDRQSVPAFLAEWMLFQPLAAGAGLSAQASLQAGRADPRWSARGGAAGLSAALGDRISHAQLPVPGLPAISWLLNDAGLRQDGTPWLLPALPPPYQASLQRGLTERHLVPADIVTAMALLAEMPEAGLAWTWLIRPDLRLRFPAAMTPDGWQAMVMALAGETGGIAADMPFPGWLFARHAPAAAPGSGTGVNLFGHFTYPSGLKVSADAIALSLAAAGTPVSQHNVVVDPSVSDLATTVVMDEARFPVSIVHVQPRPFFDDYRLRAGLPPAGRPDYRIGYWYWELEQIPADWDAAAGQCDEFWCATQFVGAALAQRYAKPVRVLFPGLAVPDITPVPRGRAGMGDGEFVFIFVFHMTSVMERKNPLGLIRAFRAAFSPQDPVRLVIKLAFGEWYPANLEALHREARGHRVTILNRLTSHAETMGLIAAADAYISLHRSEGLGLTIAEAMLLGKPAIATGYSGNLDFMTPETTRLVGYGRCLTEASDGPYPQGLAWADPDLDEAIAAMRALFADRDLAQRLGAAGKADLLARLSHQACGQAMRARLAEINPGSGR